MLICKPNDVVVVPFPFTDRQASKRRPALVVSTATFNRRGHTILAMITSASHHPWPGDHRLSDPSAAGLAKASVVRWKVFTLDNRLLVRAIGRLSENDRIAVSERLSQILGR